MHKLLDSALKMLLFVIAFFITFAYNIKRIFQNRKRCGSEQVNLANMNAILAVPNTECIFKHKPNY